jgi:hypothetical protein
MKRNKKSKLRIIAEERVIHDPNVMGDTFFPDSLRMKQPFSNLDKKDEGEALSLTYSSFFSPN